MIDEDGIEWHAPLPYDVPRQTYTPAVFALGITLIGWGFLTSWVLLASGLAITVVGVWAWTRELVWQAAQRTETGGGASDHA